MHIHHVNIRTKSLDASIAFYRDVLGLVHGPRPDFGFPGAWLYDQDKPAIHLNEAVETPSTASNAFDHVAFSTEDLNSALACLDAMGVHYAAHSGQQPSPVLSEGAKRHHHRMTRPVI
jgi:catechol 2,3-dioxygenase-like lactoylglutathione lyase family enzyme